MFDKKPQKDKPEKEAQNQIAEDTPEYQEMVMFYVSLGVRSALLLWCLLIITLAYIKLPPKIGPFDWPDQRIDATYSAGLLGNLLAGFGVSIGGGGNNKKKKNGEGSESKDSPGLPGNGQQAQTIRIEQPLIIKTEPSIATANPPKESWTEPTK